MSPLIDIPIHALICPFRHVLVGQRSRKVPVLRIRIHGSDAGLVPDDVILDRHIRMELLDWNVELFTASAFVQQRSKILPKRFEYIFSEFNRS